MPASWCQGNPISRQARDFGLDDPEVDEILRTTFSKVFREDKAILEVQQASISRSGAASIIDINSDIPGVQTRKLLRQLIAAETAATARVAAE